MVRMTCPTGSSPRDHDIWLELGEQLDYPLTDSCQFCARRAFPGVKLIMKTHENRRIDAQLFGRAFHFIRAHGSQEVARRNCGVGSNSGPAISSDSDIHLDSFSGIFCEYRHVHLLVVGVSEDCQQASVFLRKHLHCGQKEKNKCLFILVAKRIQQLGSESLGNASLKKIRLQPGI